MEEHQLIKRTVYTGTPVLVEYTLDEYAESLEQVIVTLNNWGSATAKADAKQAGRIGGMIYAWEATLDHFPEHYEKYAAC